MYEKIILTFLLLTTTRFPIHAQLFIDNGINGSLFIRNASGGTLGSYDNTNLSLALFVDGNITIEGLYDNQAAETQLTGNISNSGTFTTTGDESFVSAPNATINTSINQRISGNFTNTNDFYNVILQKNNTQYVDMGNNIEVENTLRYNNSGRIRTDIIGHTNNGSAYAYEIYLKNGIPSALIGNSIGNGAQEKYIEGKLRRKASSIGLYYFPIGVEPTSLDGMEAMELNFTANPNMDFVGYIQPATQAPLTRNILCDIGKDPGAGQQNYSGCVGTPDGIFDWYYLENSMDLSHEWVINPSGASTGYAYDIFLHPGSNLDINNASYYTIPNSCGLPYKNQRLRVVAKDGIVGGNQQVGLGNWAPWAHLSAYIWCQFDDADLDISLKNQTSFSSYRIHGTSSQSNTALPVELVDLRANSINNTYIQVVWNTASEFNNLGFEVQRSIDGANFSPIGFINGNGTSNLIHNYYFDDNNIQLGVVYYYRLKQIDFNDSYKYTYIVSASLEQSDKITMNDIYPNPTTSESYINVYSPSDNILNYSIYNESGQSLLQNDITVKKGNNIIPIATTYIAKGIYFIVFKLDDTKIYKKLIKQ